MTPIWAARKHWWAPISSLIHVLVVYNAPIHFLPNQPHYPPDRACQPRSVNLDRFQTENLPKRQNLDRPFDTSSISITRLANYTERPESFVGMHFMNPVPMMKLVEVIRGHKSSDTVVEATLELSRRLGKEPWEAQDYPGFVANRILAPMLNEAVYALMEGVATREAIDEVMKLGMGHPMGPLALADFIGLDVCLNILELLQDELGDPKYRPCPLLRRMVAAGDLGRKSGRGFYDYS